MAHDGTGTLWITTDPTNSEFVSDGAKEIRDLRIGIEKRINKEHDTLATGNLGGEHKQGSAKAYHQAVAPTKRPDGTTTLTAADAGRLFIDSDDGLLDYWDGSAFVLITAGAFAIGSVGTAALADDSVTKDKINADIAGLGLEQAVGGELDVKVDDIGIEIVGDTLQIKSISLSDLDFVPGTELLTTIDASSQATVDFTSKIDGTFATYEIDISGLTVSVDAVDLRLLVSDDGGATFKSGAADYTFAGTTVSVAGLDNFSDASAANILLSNNIRRLSSDAGHSYSATIRMRQPANSSLLTSFDGGGGYVDSASRTVSFIVDGRFLTASVIDAIRLEISGGLILTGKFKLTGIK